MNSDEGGQLLRRSPLWLKGVELTACGHLQGLHAAYYPSDHCKLGKISNPCSGKVSLPVQYEGFKSVRFKHMLISWSKTLLSLFLLAKPQHCCLVLRKNRQPGYLRLAPRATGFPRRHLEMDKGSCFQDTCCDKCWQYDHQRMKKICRHLVMFCQTCT